MSLLIFVAMVPFPYLFRLKMHGGCSNQLAFRIERHRPGCGPVALSVALDGVCEFVAGDVDAAIGRAPEVLDKLGEHAI